MASKNWEQYAFYVWPTLCRCAADGSVISYKELGDQVGLHPRTMRLVLSVIQDYCMDRGLPPLTILVVSQATRQPGQGFIAWDADDLPSGFEEVYRDKTWADLPNPFEYAEDGSSRETLAAAVINDPAEAQRVYVQVRDRGIIQSIFRCVLLAIYRRRCAFCGLSFPEALEAAHIISWSEATTAQRLDPRNGLLLCSVHHELFDANLMTVDQDGRIRFADPDPQAEYSAVDQLMSRALDGEIIALPASIGHRPSSAALRWREQYAAARAN